MSERVFTTEPEMRRHLYGLSMTKKRASLLMESLYQNGFIVEAPYAEVRKFVIGKTGFIGADPRVVSFYIGRPACTLEPHQLPQTDVTILYEKSRALVFKKYTARRHLREIQGLCQQLGYMKLDYRGENEIPFVIFNHKEVPLPYHLKQTPLLGTEKSEQKKVAVENVARSKDDLCVTPIAIPARRKGVFEIDKRERRVSKQHTQIRSNLESESILQQAGDGLTPAQRAELEERDRKRLGILNRELLPALEKHVKSQG